MIDDRWDPRAVEPLRWVDVVGFLRVGAVLGDRSGSRGWSPGREFAARFGMPVLPVQPPMSALPGESSEAVAVFAQDRLARIDRMARIADAHRTVALLSAYEASIEDLQVRYGRQVGSRAGLGAQAFFRTTGLVMGLHPARVAHLVDTATTLRDRLPATWAVYRSGAATWRAVEIAVKLAEGLDPDRWADYDQQASRAVVSSTRLRADLHRIRERLQDDTASQRANVTKQLRAVYLDRHADGSASLTLTGPAADLTAIDQALTRAAVAAHGTDGQDRPDGQGRTVTQLRYDLARDLLIDGFGRLADPAASVPQRTPIEVTLILTIPALAWLGRTSEQATIAGYGPIDLETAKHLAGSAKSMIRVLTDPITGVRLTMDGTVYRPPADLDRWVRIRDGRSRFPGGTRPAWLCDIDHAREWQHGGPTADWNLITVSRAEHLQKSADLWQEELHANGHVGWDDPWGHHYDDPPDHPADPAPTDLLPPDPDPPCPF